MSSADPLEEAVRKVWRAQRDNVLARVGIIEAAVAGDAQLEPARREAHALAGSLGTFGFARGSEIARELKRGLESGAEPDADARSKMIELARELRGELSA